MAVHLHLSTSVRGHAYDEPLNFPPGVEAVRSVGLPEGLRYDPTRRRLIGVASQSGQYPISFLSATGRLIAKAILTVHEGTQAMWENLEPPADAPFPSLHAACEHLTGMFVQAWAGSKRGRQHARLAAFREDAYAMASMGEWTIMAVADGAGSCSMSREGAAIAVKAAVQSLSDTVSEGLGGHALAQALPQSFEAAARAISERADSLGLPAKELSTTLSLLCHHHGSAGHTFIALGIGDSPVLLLDAAGFPHVLHQPDEGDYSGETHFLPAPPPSGLADALASRVRVVNLPAFTAAYLMTDGIHDPFFETQRGLLASDRWATFLESLSPVLSTTPDDRAEALLVWLDFWSRGNHDDRTLIILQPHEPH